MADIKGETCEANSFHGSKKIKYQVFPVVDEQSVTTTVNEDGSILVSEDDLKCRDTDMRSSDGTDSKLRSSVKSEISTETSSPLNCGLITKRPHNFQHKTESSSCSNSSSVILPVSFQNYIYQESSKEAYSFRSSIDSSNLNKKEDEEISQEWVYTTATNEKQQAGIVDKISFSDHSDNLNCTNPTVRRSKGDFFVKESSESSMTKHSKVDNGDTFTAGFDLNEDFNGNGMDDCIQPVVAAVSSHNVIVKVAAKPGVPSGHPMIPLKFEGGLGWKGSAQTSAFRPTFLSKISSGKAVSENQPRQVFRGIDLNVASVEEDIAANGMPTDHDGISPQSKVDSKQAKSLWIDLNQLYDGADEFTQPSIPPKTENSFSVDLNLNADSSIVDESSNFHWLDQDPVSVNPGKRDSSFTAHGYLADMSALQHRVASLQQPKLPFLSQSLSPHYYSSKDAPFLAKMFEDRQSSFLGLNTQVGERVQHQGAWYATSMKRKETEGG